MHETKYRNTQTFLQIIFCAVCSMFNELNIFEHYHYDCNRIINVPHIQLKYQTIDYRPIDPGPLYVFAVNSARILNEISFSNET